MVDAEGAWVRSDEDAAMFHVLVSSAFEFPVVVAWLQSDGWHMGGEQPWKGIAESTDPTKIRLQRIPISFPDTEERLREREGRQ